MSAPHELALRLAVHKVITDQLKAMRGQLDGQARTVLEPGDRVTAKLPSGEKLGSVTLASGRVTVRVVDETAFTRWVVERFPSEVEQVVRESFQKALLDSVKRDGGWVDKTSGEVVHVPGVAVTTGEPSPSVRLAQGAQEAVAKAWQSGALANVLGEVLQPAIEAGDES